VGVEDAEEESGIEGIGGLGDADHGRPMVESFGGVRVIVARLVRSRWFAVGGQVVYWKKAAGWAFCSVLFIG